VKAEQPLTRASYIEGMRRGRTFVTNGPILTLEADGQPIGGELQLSKPGPITIEGQVRFDPEREDIHTIEVVLGGRVVPAHTRTLSPGVVEVRAEVEVSRSSWVALRVAGSKLDEAPFVLLDVPGWVQGLVDRVASGWSFEGRDEALSRLSLHPSAAHTGVIYVDVPGTRGAESSELARAWIARLDAIESQLDDAHITEIPIADWIPYSDGVSEAHLRRHRPALISAIATARNHYRSLIETDTREGQPR
jgi:hypothetical protein